MLTDAHAYLRGERRAVTDALDDYFDPAATAVVSIDMHRSHLDGPDCPCPGLRGQEAIQLTNRFHRTAREVGVPIIHVRTYAHGYVAAVSMTRGQTVRRGVGSSNGVARRHRRSTSM
jgi:hypothetical protein